MAYITATELKRYINTAQTGDDTIIGECITRAQEWIESHCRRRFEASTATRYYKEESVADDVLYLDDDLISVTTLTNADTAVITGSYYWLLPRNDPPYQMIQLKSSEAWSFNTDGEISVLGSWGWSATPPEDIKQAAIRLSAYLYRQRFATLDTDRPIVGENGLILQPSEFPSDIFRLLAPYRKVSAIR